MNVQHVSNGKHRIMAEINMIPFIDISLVLLIIFMVMTPFLVRSQIKVNLPKANAAEKESSQQNMVEILVDRNGAILIDGRTVAPDAVEATLKGLVTDLENQPVVIEADKDVPFEHVVVVMDAAKKIGVAKLGVGVKQLEPERKKEKKSQAK